MTRRVSAFAFALALALGVAASGCTSDRPITHETRNRERFVRELAARERMTDIWSLTARSDLQFEDGIAGIELLAREGHPSQPVRWIGPRAHLRIRGDGDGDRRLEIRGRVDLAAIQTRPIVAASIDGHEVSAGPVDDDGSFVIAVTIRAAWLSGWSDVYLTLSSVHEPWKDPEGRTAGKLTVARLEAVTWEPVAGSMSIRGQ